MLSMEMGQPGNLTRHRRVSVGAQLGHKIENSQAQSGHSRGTVGAQSYLGHSWGTIEALHLRLIEILCPKCAWPQLCPNQLFFIFPEIVPQLCPSCAQLFLPWLCPYCAPSIFMPRLCPDCASTVPKSFQFCAPTEPQLCLDCAPTVPS